MEMQSNQPSAKKITGNFLINNIFLLYTLLIIFLKSVIFIGLTLDSKHVTIDFRDSWWYTSNHFAFYAGFVVLLLSFSFLFKNRSRMWFIFLTNLFISIILAVDLWYFRGFNTMPTLMLLKEGNNLTNMSSSILGMLRLIDLVFFIDIILLFPLTVFFRNILKDTKRNILSFVLMFVISLGLISYIPLNLYFSGKDVKNTIVYFYDSTVTSRNLSPLGYNIYCIYTFFNEGKTVKLSNNEVNDIKKWFSDKKENLPDNKYKGIYKDKNLLFIQVESLEKFVINQKINGQEITPNLNKLLTNSMYFSDIHEQVHEGNTADAELMGNTSVFPLQQGATSFLYPYTVYNNSMPKIMTRNGYSTTAIHPDEGSFWNWMVMLKSVGFEKCIDLTSFNDDENIILGLSDGSFLRQVEPMIAKQKQPFYTFMVTLSSHTPFTLPYKYRDLQLPPELNGTYLGGYFQCANYTDKQLGIFLDRLQKDGVLDNTVVVIYGDHEGIHKYFPDSLKGIKPSQDWWLDNHKQTPLIIYQNHQKGEEIKITGGEIDILPTVCYLMGINEKEYENTAMGRNLLKTGKSFAVLQGGEYVGDDSNKSQVESAKQSLDIADMIIRGNYFKDN